MNDRRAFVPVSVLPGLLPLAAHSQQWDMEAMAKWGAADLLR